MSYQEKSIVVSLVSYLMILGYYSTSGAQDVDRRRPDRQPALRLWAVVIVATILVNILGNIFANIVLSHHPCHPHRFGQSGALCGRRTRQADRI